MDVRSLTGSIFLGWQVLEELGAGADGIVYLVLCDGEKRALKLFYPEAIAKHGLEEQIERLQLQLELVGEKRHRNLVEIYDGGYLPEENTIYILMEYIPGTSLDKLVGKIPPNSIYPLISQLADVARFLEERDLVHRDIKPANIVISDDYTSLCLLDLGIIFRSPFGEGAEDRLSGDEFVASLRYSPPEFVWREEDSADLEAWRAITFYQIGATLYDMIEGKVIFSGMDTPRARLYDCVKYRTPDFQISTTEDWIIVLAKSCLVKSWRERLSLVSWESFKGPTAASGVNSKRNAIRLVQIHAEEARKLDVLLPVSANDSISGLWKLQDEVFLELRNLLINEPIFPHFNNGQTRISDREYKLSFEFDTDTTRAFNTPLKFYVSLNVDGDSQNTVQVAVVATVDGTQILDGLWIEPLNTERVYQICELSLYSAAEIVVSSR